MFRDKLNELGALAVVCLMRCLAAAWELAWLNRKMTSKGLVAVTVFVAAHYGLEISPEAQVLLASLLFLYLGLVGRDKLKRRNP